MTFKEVEENVLKIADIYKKELEIDMNKEFAAIKLFEEVGEFAQAILIHNKQSRPEKYQNVDTKKLLEDELADVVGMAIINAQIHDIDLLEAFKRKWRFASLEESNE